MSDSALSHRWQPTRLRHLWDSPGNNTGVCCHFLLQCMKVKSESEVVQSCLTFSDPWTAAFQVPPSMGFSRQENWSGVPLPSPPYIDWLSISTVDFNSVLGTSFPSSFFHNFSGPIFLSAKVEIQEIAAMKMMLIFFLLVGILKYAICEVVFVLLQESVNDGSQAKSGTACVFEIKSCFLYLCIFMTAFTLQHQNKLVTTDIKWLTKPKIFSICPFTK